MSTETRDALRDHRRELRTEAGRDAYEAVREVVWYGVRDRFPGSLDLVAYVGDRLLELEDAALRATPSTETRDALRAEDAARLFHETYERLAPSFGYETRRDSAVPWDQVPEQNRRLMVAVAGEVVAALRVTDVPVAEGLREAVIAAEWMDPTPEAGSGRCPACHVYRANGTGHSPYCWFAPIAALATPEPDA